MAQHWYGTHIHPRSHCHCEECQSVADMFFTSVVFLPWQGHLADDRSSNMSPTGQIPPAKPFPPRIPSIPCFFFLFLKSWLFVGFLFSSPYRTSLLGLTRDQPWMAVQRHAWAGLHLLFFVLYLYCTVPRPLDLDCDVDRDLNLSYNTTAPGRQYRERGAHPMRK